MEIYANDILNKPAAQKKTISEATKGTISGAAFGILGGILYSYFNNKEYLKNAIIGAIAGGVISSLFMYKKTDS